MLNNLATTVATPRKCPGRNSPHNCSDMPVTSTKARCARGYISPGGCEDQCYFAPAAKIQVGCQIPRIAIVVFLTIELDRVDKDADHHGIAFGMRPVYQSAVALVQRAHRGDEADLRSALPEILAERSNFGNGRG